MNNKEESRRLKVYRELQRMTRLEETLLFLKEWSQGKAINFIEQGNQEGSRYWHGRADGIEDLMARIRNSKKIRKKRLIQNDEEIL